MNRIIPGTNYFTDCDANGQNIEVSFPRILTKTFNDDEIKNLPLAQDNVTELFPAPGENKFYLIHNISIITNFSDITVPGRGYLWSDPSSAFFQIAYGNADAVFSNTYVDYPDSTPANPPMTQVSYLLRQGYSYFNIPPGNIIYTSLVGDAAQAAYLDPLIGNFELQLNKSISFFLFRINEALTGGHPDNRLSFIMYHSIIDINKLWGVQ